MGKLSLKDKICFLTSWALLLMCSAAERQYFRQSRNLSWNEAREHCQTCFKDLVTLTPENTQTIAQNLTSDSWVGLRKNFHSNQTQRMSWSRWANGDPLAFQNWYPGSPVLTSPVPKTYCCSCSCTCPERRGTTTSSGATNETASHVTGLNPAIRDLGGSTCAPSDQNYTEDSCVVMLSFGAWVEKNCSELLPFICYEDSFPHQSNVTNVTTKSATLTWLPGPGEISHYDLEVKGDKEVTASVTDLTYYLYNLTAGTRYTVQVYPVKCKRVLNAQEVAFYTAPNKVKNLKFTDQTETSISLSWNKPAGNLDFYLIKFPGRQIKTVKEESKVDSLIPGSPYTFTFLSGVKDNSTWSEEASITAYTKPRKVSNLRVTKNTKNSLLLNWVQPEGKATGFRVKAMDDNKDILYDKVVTQTEVTVTGLPMSSRITLSVTALANNILEGDSVTTINYTAPGPVSNLTLVTTHDSLNATWISPKANFSSFTITLELDGKNEEMADNVKEPWKYFNGLKSAANYTVIVNIVIGHIIGPSVKSSNFTLPLPPTNATVTSSNKEQIMFQWKNPVNTATVMYTVKLSSSFWGHSWSDTVNHNSYTFHGLKSGTMYEFEVRTKVEGISSSPATVSHRTTAEEREISLSMLCSSTEILLCDESTTWKSVFNQLREHFNKLWGNTIFWKLEEQESEN